MRKVPIAHISDSRLEAGIRPDEMRKFGDRVETTLQRYDALPRRRADRSIIGDLAALHLHARLALEAVRALVADPRSAAGNHTFEDRLMDLVAQVDMVHGCSKNLKKPLERLLEDRCGPAGSATASLRAASTSIKGLSRKGR